MNVDEWMNECVGIRGVICLDCGIQRGNYAFLGGWERPGV